MTDIVAAFAQFKAAAVTLIGDTLPIWWPDETRELPNDPAPFVYFEFLTEAGEFIEIGGGRGRNRYRNSGEVNAYVFVPKGSGLSFALQRAESVAAIFRSYRGGGVNCRGATVHPVGQGEGLNPPGTDSAAGNYACAVVSIPLYFDQTA